jgi:hypothetical protein
MRPLRIVLLIGGILAALISFGLVAGGGVLVWAHETQRDAAGFYTTGPHSYSTSGYALTSVKVDLGVHPGRWVGTLGTVRIGVGPGQGKDLFVGIGPQSAVEAYLARVERSVVTQVKMVPFRVTYTEVPGSAVPAPPAEQSFWIAHASGAAGTTLTWDIRSGTWMLVVMNADASRGVDANLSIGAKTGILLPIGIGLLVAGVVLGSGAALMVFFAVRRPRRAPAGPPPPARPDIEPAA